MADRSLGFNITATDRASSSFTKLAEAVEKVSDNLDELGRKKATPKIVLDSGGALAEIKAVSGELGKLKNLSLKVTVNGGTKAIQQLRTLSALVADLDNRDITINVNADTAAAAAQLAALRAQLNALGGVTRIRINASGLTAAGRAADGYSQKMSRAKLITLAVAGAIPLISSALIALPGLVSPFVTSLGAAVVGVDGITKSAKDLNEEFDQMQGLVEGVFSEQLLPVMGDVERMLPSISVGLEGNARALSGFAKQITDVTSSRRGLEGINDTFAQSNQIIADLGPGIGIATDNFIRLADEGTEALVPMTAEFTKMSVEWDRTIDRMSRTGELEGGIQSLVLVLGSLGNMLPAVVELGNASLTALGPTLASGIDLTTTGVKGLTEGFRMVPGPVGDGIIVIGSMVVSLKLLQKVMATAFVTSKIAGFSAALTGAAAGMALASTRMGAMSGAGMAGARAMGGMATAVGKMGVALPVLGAAVIGGALAWDKFTTNVDEGAQAMLTGGRAFHELDLATTEAIGPFGKLTNTWGEARRKANELLLEMTPLQRAQQLVTFATNEHGYAVTKWGEHSDQAVAAAGTLSWRVRELEAQQKAAAEATKDHTQKMIEQMDQMLAQADASLGYKMSLIDIKDAEDALAAALRDHGAGSREAERAELNLQIAQKSSIQLAGEAAAATFADADSKDAQAAKTRASTDEIFKLAYAAGTALPPELAVMIGKMNDAELAAHGVVIKTNEIGQKIAVLQGPGGKAEVVITANGADHVAGSLADIRAQIQWLDDHDTVFVRVEQLIAGPVMGQGGNQLGPGGATGGGIWKGDIIRRRGGGPVIGPGGPTSDSILAMAGQQPYRLSDGEWVDPANVVKAAGGFAGMAKVDQMILAGLIPGLAGGGGIGTSVSSASPGAVSATVDASIPLTPETVAALEQALAPLTGAVDNLRGTGLVPLSDELNATTMPSLAAWRDRTGIELPGAFDELAMRHGNAMRVVDGQHDRTLANTNAAFDGIKAGLASVGQFYASTADGIAVSFARVMPATANPLRYTLQTPINAGLVPAWAEIDKFFDLKRPFGGVPVNFATGGSPGEVFGPGTGTSDSIDARVARREWIVPADIAQRIKPFLRTITFGGAGFAEAMQAAGAGQPRPGFAAGGEVIARAQDWYRQNLVGHPYLWGGTGPGGFDCSGAMGAVANFLLGQPLWRRRFATADMAGGREAGGFKRGLHSAFTIGVNPGVHTGGTLGGVNIESTTKNGHSGPRYGGDASGSTDSQFPFQYHLPEAGGQFVAGAVGGGGMDVGAYVSEKLAPMFKMIDAMPALFGNGNPTVLGMESAKQTAAGAIAWATAHINPPVGSPGGGVERWRGVMERALVEAGESIGHTNLGLMQMESESGGNPNAVNDWDSNWAAGHPSVGLMQVIAGTFRAYAGKYLNTGPFMHGVSVDPMANVFAATKYTKARYGSLPNGWKGHGYANGAIVTRPTMGIFGEAGPEVILPMNRPDRARSLARRAGVGGGVTIINNINSTGELSTRKIVGGIVHKVRVAERRGSW